MNEAKFRKFDSIEKTVKRIGPAQTPIVILDDVLENPEQVRQRAISSEFTVGNSVSNYYPGYTAPCGMSGMSEFNESLARFMWFEIFGSPQVPSIDFSGVTSKSFFACFAPAMDAKYVNVHTDFNNWLAVLIYLKEESESGTAFWKDKETGLQSFFGGDILQIQKMDSIFDTKYAKQLEPFLMRPEFNIEEVRTNLFAKREIYPPFPSSSYAEWDLLEYVPSKFNRLLVYPTWQLHSVAFDNYQPADSIADSRMTLNTFINYPIPQVWGNLPVNPLNDIVI